MNLFKRFFNLRLVLIFAGVTSSSQVHAAMSVDGTQRLVADMQRGYQLMMDEVLRGLTSEAGATREALHTMNRAADQQREAVDLLTAATMRYAEAAERQNELRRVEELNQAERERLDREADAQLAVQRAQAHRELEAQRHANNIALEDRKAMLSREKIAAIFTGFKDCGASFANYVTDKKNAAKFMAILVAILVALYGLPIAARYLEAVLRMPRIISETSRGRLGKKSATTVSINDVIVDPATHAQLADIVDRITMAREDGENLFNVLFYGAPGTGKTMFAKALAYHSGLDYAIMSGSEFTKITDTNVAISELQKLVRWAERSSKGLLIFIDEAESFLADRTLPTTTKWSQDLLNAFLAAVPKPTAKKMMFVFATNHPFKLDPAVLSRIGERVQFKIPAFPEREKILKMYIDKFGKEKGVVLSKDFDLTGLAKQLEGIAPREIEYISEKMVQLAKQANSSAVGTICPLSMQVATYVADLMKTSIQEAQNWDKDRQNWVNQQIAVH